MDYTSDGKVLKKYQWDNIHNPESMIGWFSFTPARGINDVLRILECGVNVKSANAPVYANLDFKGSTGKVRWFRYIK